MPNKTSRRQFMRVSAATGLGIAPAATVTAANIAGEDKNPARQARLAMRHADWTGPTVAQMPDYVQCNLVVTMRWMTPAQAVIATQLTGRFPANHGAPVHIGDPDAIGADLSRPIYGRPVDRIPSGTMPVFWACGVTPQKSAESAKPDLMITHAPGHGFITDLKADQICLP
jgi:uncharacterized protein YcsI (UPF0317 family)